MTNTSSSARRALIVRNDFSPFGNKLIERGYVDADKMRQALQESRKNGTPLTKVLETMTSTPLPAEMVRLYKKQQLFELKVLYGVETVDPELEQIPTAGISDLIKSLVPIDMCRRYKLLPITKNDNPPSVLIAMVDPDNLEAQDDLKRLLRPQGLELRRKVMTREDYEQLIQQYLDEEIKQQQIAAEAAKANSRQIDVTEFDEMESQVKEEVDGSLDEEDANAAPVIKLVNNILAKALTEKVSDIHIEPQEEDLRIRFRKDGVLREAFDRFPKKIIPAVTSRFKILANLDIAERRIPQDGRIRRIFEGRKVDFRVNTIPSRYGEKICMRILDNSSTQLGLDKLISNPETLESVRDMAMRPFGLILVTGPTGSGKSTTLYSILAERNDPGVNISTAEDPIEYGLPGINQCQVIREKGVNFASILRAFMRQDPDVILVGETRDVETAKTAIEAALTGHLVMTTLHANDAPSSVARLDEMGVEPFMVSAALLGVCAQRLMRRVCDECRVPYQPTVERLARFGLSATKEGAVTFYTANELNKEQETEAKQNGTLCPKCKGLGYKGRVGVYEVMRVTERLQTLINKNATVDRIKEAAVEDGMVTLLAYSLNLVREGATTLEEVERVTFTDTGLEAELKAKRKASLTCSVCGAGLQQEWLDCPYCCTSRFEE